MTTKKLPVINVRGMSKALSCFDRELCIKRDQFEDVLTIAKSSTDEFQIEPSDVPLTLKFGSLYLEFSAIVEWVDSVTDTHSYTYYLHLHDNIIEELALFDLFNKAAFEKYLQLFHSNPADEGGSNVLGVVDLNCNWIFVIEVDNQGGFLVEFFGTSELCSNLRSRLANPNISE